MLLEWSIFKIVALIVIALAFGIALSRSKRIRTLFPLRSSGLYYSDVKQDDQSNDK